MNKSVYVKTYGCQMNVYDSGRMGDALAASGYQPATSPENADLVILNTCHIREKAEDKVFSDLGRVRMMRDARRQRGKNMLIAVGGCVAQAQGELIIKRAPFVDMVFGPQNYADLPQMVQKAEAKHTAQVAIEFPAVPKFDQLPKPGTPKGRSAFLSVQEGCDKFCTFCVVPYTRGAEYSRPVTDILREAKQLVAQNVCEITLLGQNVNAYHGKTANGSEWGLGELIHELATIDGLERIRYTTSHPRDMDDMLIRAHGEVPQLMPYLHLPVQAGSDRILKRMNRKHTAADYLRIVDKLREARPDLALSSDFIVGFPGETAEDFDNTMRLVEQANYAQAYSFKYSARPGTPAANDDDQLSEAEKSDRLQQLQALLNRQQEAFNQRTIGKTLPVLFEKTGKQTNQWVGKTPYLQSVHVVHPENLSGQLLDVTISESFANSLRGTLTEPYREPAYAA